MITGLDPRGIVISRIIYINFIINGLVIINAGDLIINIIY